MNAITLSYEYSEGEHILEELYVNGELYLCLERNYPDEHENFPGDHYKVYYFGKFRWCKYEEEYCKELKNGFAASGTSEDEAKATFNAIANRFKYLKEAVLMK